jgi:uncharacterized repeat protein (TIGR03803 family)
MNKPIYVGLTTGRIFRLIAPLILIGGAFNADAQTETNLHSFVGYPNDGEYPYAALVQGSDGNFYGTTYQGGANADGNIFRISPGGSETNFYAFSGPQLDDGFKPAAGLVQGRDGNFYGTTYEGGSSGNCGDTGCGTIFRITPNGIDESILHSFRGHDSVGYVNADGAGPNGLVQGSDGYLYGTTVSGGTNGLTGSGLGTVFRITASNSAASAVYNILHSFTGTPDGSGPTAGLVQGSDSNFYGTTTIGGTTNYGTVFQINSSGSVTILHSFGSFPKDGLNPYAGLVQGNDGNFYGTTQFGGTNGLCGTVFRISPSGSYTSLYSFVGYPNDGQWPVAGLVQGSDGNFYGTTEYGGNGPCSAEAGNGCGTVFRISPSGTEKILYSFVGSPTDGENPQAGLVQGSDGSFYGTAYYGGTSTNCGHGCGSVFKISVPLNPPPNQITSVHIAATNITLSIPSIAGETYQLQFSSSMNPTNWVNVPSVSVTNSIGALLTVTNFGGAIGPQGFYRFDVTP